MAISGDAMDPWGALDQLDPDLESSSREPQLGIQTEADLVKSVPELDRSVSVDLEEECSAKKDKCRSIRSSTSCSDRGVSLLLVQNIEDSLSTFSTNRPTTSLAPASRHPASQGPLDFHSKAHHSHQDYKYSTTAPLSFPVYNKSIDIHFTNFVATSAPAPDEKHLASRRPLHFHRKLDHSYHDHKISTPAPLTLTKGRKYILPDRTMDLSPTQSQHALDIADLTDVLLHSNLRSSPAPREPNPGEIAHRLRHWTYDPYMAAESERRERENPFPDVDMNAGWNRARCDGIMYFAEQHEWMQVLEGGPEERLKVKESLNSFSFWSQLEPFELDMEEVSGMFDKVFVGESYGQFGWARTPGGWWAARKGLFSGDSGVCFLDYVKERTMEIADTVDKWRKMRIIEQSEAEGSKQKRKYSGNIKSSGDLTFKKQRSPSKISEEVMSDEWRARRRTQEIKAGRWTDGTLKMDRLWAEFHWVLDDDPRDMTHN
jgi:hypothetical protein